MIIYEEKLLTNKSINVLINIQKLEILFVINEEYLQKLAIQIIFLIGCKCYWISLHHKIKMITFFKSILSK